MNGGHFEFTVKNGCEGPTLVLTAMLRTREAVNEFIGAFNPLQLAMFPGDEGPQAEPEPEPEADADVAGSCAAGAGDGADDRAEASAPAVGLARAPEPLPGTRAGDALAALRAGAFDHRDPNKRFGMTRYEARIVYERLIANGWWTPASEGEAA